MHQGQHAGLPGGYAPAICVEFARKALLSDVRPTFYEVEEAVSSLPAAV
jgi:chemotaxis protein MotA